MENEVEHKPETQEQEEEYEDSYSSDSEIDDALDLLDSRNDEHASSLDSLRPNAHGGHIPASPLEELEGRLNIAMSNTVTTAIRGSVRDMAIGKTRTTEKADRATVEQAIDPRTRMALFKMLNKGVFQDINGCISTGKEANFGACAGYSSPTQDAIRKDHNLSLAEYSLFGSILTFSAMIGAITSGPIADFVG
ncbi:unnamed protein product [Trifolium pratense]|uniref:Uncharacterized protein n=1 Tax=Trifolium pratense TaxID=57577 RepID=A0ACB0KTX1_TRIPR|nr:unnamed protein product [Trifolium pratense]